MNTSDKTLKEKAYMALVSILCDGDKQARDIHRNGITLEELERLYQLYSIGPVES